MYRYLTIGCAILCLTACCYCRTSIDVNELKSLTVGQTTTDDVKTKFGTPNDTSTKDGETTWSYNFLYEDENWASAIPVAGGMVSAPYNKTQADSFVFDAQGKLKSYAFNDVTKLPGE